MDGTHLAANIFRPKGNGPFPTILSRTPYGKGGKNHGQGRFYASQGYAMVVQDCRGRGDSKGLWDPFRYDADDGFDTQQWVGEQPWCNGKIGTAGGSYVGWTQWASAPKGSPYLKAMAPTVPFCDAYDNAYCGGAFQLALMMHWGAAVGGAHLPPDRMSEAFRFLPLNRFDDQFEKEVCESEWPLARTRYTPFYLRSDGNATDISGDGVLSETKPKPLGTDRFTYDPHNPTPTAGGNNLGGAPAGPFDQTKIEQREDVLVYSSRPLTEAVEVTGPVKMILYAATSAKDTDFTAKLVDVHPNGEAYNLCDGILRARWRNSRSQPDPIEPGTAYRYDFNATLLHLMGLDHERLTFHHNGLERRLTNVHGRIIKEVLA